MNLLEIEGLTASINGQQILRGLDLVVPAGEVHIIMGPNGAGKSTLAHVLAGREDYEVSGKVLLDGEEILGLNPEERAAKGVFLAFQHPVEIPGVGNSYFLRTALNAIRRAHGEEELDAMDFMSYINERMELVQMDRSFLTRSVNEGFSGGEKKRNEVLQMAILEPRLAILDETDSGLDIDAVRIVAAGANAMRAPDRSMVIITHHQSLLQEVVPDSVHVLAGGKIARTGGPELAAELETTGYAEFEPAGVK